MINNDDNLIYLDEINEVKAIKVMNKVWLASENKEAELAGRWVRRIRVLETL